MRLRCSNGPSVFLDKLCIHQENEGLKVLGIRSLETFVRNSKCLVLLYDSMTFERLWCTFETAMFAHDRLGDVQDLCFVCNVFDALPADGRVVHWWTQRTGSILTSLC